MTTTLTMAGREQLRRDLQTPEVPSVIRTTGRRS